MSLLIWVLADIIHFAKIIVVSEMFFSFQKRRLECVKHKLVFSVFAMIGMSAFIYFFDNHFIESFLYVVAIILFVYWLYGERLLSVTIVVTWMVLALSMIDTMVAVLYNISMVLLKMDGELFSNLGVSLISLLFVLMVGRIYRRNTVLGMNIIGIANLFWFTVLLSVDTLVVTIIEFVNADIKLEKYEDIYRSAVIFVIVGMFIQLAAVILLFTQRNIYKEKKLLTEKYLSEQKGHYEYLEKRELETKKFRHDFRSHLELISNMAKNHEVDEIQDYLEKLHIKIDELGNVVTVQNGIVDAILNQYYTKALQLGIKMEIKGRFPSDSEIDAYDICTIFSNILSNAIEAAEKTEEKYISVQCRYSEECIIIVVENSFCSEQQDEKLVLKTQKGDLDYHGFGLVNVKESVEKYNGFLDIEIKNDRFLLKIFINRTGN